MDPALAPQAPLPRLEPVADGWFEREVQPHGEALKSYLASRYPCLTDVDNLVQESLVRVLRTWHKTAVASPKALLFTVGRNLAKDILRRQKVICYEPIEDNDKSTVLNDDTDVVEDISHQQELRLLEAAIQALPERCKQIMILRVKHDLPQKAIAQRLGISISAVEKQLARGIRHCAEYFGRQAP